MYYQYFGLSEAPFSIAVNPRYLYMSPRHREALAHLLYGVGAGGGFILLTGEVGTGKTTINRCLLEQLPDSADVAIVLNPALDALDLLATVCDELGIERDSHELRLKHLTDALHQFLLSNHQRGRKTVLMIDEAQHLGFDVLEQIRLLTNLETNEEKLLHIILIGQPELAAKLAKPELRQLNQRITARFELKALSADETGAYVRHRLHVAGLPAGRALFPPRLLRAIHRESGGIPRLINLLCDRMLLGAYGRGSDTLDRSLLKSAVVEVGGSADQKTWPQRSAVAGSFVAVTVVIAFAALLLLRSEHDQNSPSVPEPVSVQPQIVESTIGAGINTDSNTNQQLPADTQIPATGQNLAQRVDEAVDSVVDWVLSKQQGSRALLGLYNVSLAIEVPAPCSAALGAELRCETQQWRSWNALELEGRPALLSLIDERRVESSALLLGVEDDNAVLAGREGALRRVPLAELARVWSGEASVIWRRPTAIARTLQKNDTGADVALVALWFAALDQQPEPLTDFRYTDRLEQRVRLFQQARNLKADGVLGEQTLRALSLAGGDDMGFVAAREKWVDDRLNIDEQAP